MCLTGQNFAAWEGGAILEPSTLKSLHQMRRNLIGNARGWKRVT